MKPFDLEKALAGEPVVTRQGQPVTQVCMFNNTRASCPVFGACNGLIRWWNTSGQVAYDEEHADDLFMAGNKKEGWVNIYPDQKLGDMIYPTETQADGAKGQERIACVKIEWEE